MANIEVVAALCVVTFVLRRLLRTHLSTSASLDLALCSWSGYRYWAKRLIIRVDFVGPIGNSIRAHVGSEGRFIGTQIRTE